MNWSQTFSHRFLLRLQASWPLWTTSTCSGAACWWLRPPSASSTSPCSPGSALTACWPGRGSVWPTAWRAAGRSGRASSPDTTQVKPPSVWAEGGSFTRQRRQRCPTFRSQTPGVLPKVSVEESRTGPWSRPRGKVWNKCARLGRWDLRKGRGEWRSKPGTNSPTKNPLDKFP